MMATRNSRISSQKNSPNVIPASAVSASSGFFTSTILLSLSRLRRRLGVTAMNKIASRRPTEIRGTHAIPQYTGPKGLINKPVAHKAKNNTRNSVHAESQGPLEPDRTNNNVNKSATTTAAIPIEYISIALISGVRHLEIFETG